MGAEAEGGPGKWGLGQLQAQRGPETQTWWRQMGKGEAEGPEAGAGRVRHGESWGWNPKSRR